MFISSEGSLIVLFVCLLHHCLIFIKILSNVVLTLRRSYNLNFESKWTILGKVKNPEFLEQVSTVFTKEDHLIVVRKETQLPFFRLISPQI